MSLKLMYITNNLAIACLAEQAGVDRIFVDLELLGKQQRQGHLNTVISRHSIDDVSAIKKVLNTSELLVRINPVHEQTKNEIDAVISRGADIVMLPMFKTADEIEEFIRYVDGRAKTCLLLETAQALTRIDDIVNVPGIDEIHIGLNDLHLSMGLTFMFELLSGGIVEYACGKIRKKHIVYGFGGFARIGLGMLPAEYIIMEHYRLGSSMAILSRSFCDAHKHNVDDIKNIFNKGIADIRSFESLIKTYTHQDFEKNRLKVKGLVKKII